MLIFLQKNNVGSDTVVVVTPTFIIEPFYEEYDTSRTLTTDYKYNVCPL